MTIQYNIVLTVFDDINTFENIEVFVGIMNVSNDIISAFIDSTTQTNAITNIGYTIQDQTATNTYNALNNQFGCFILEGEQYTEVLGDYSGYLAVNQNENIVMTNDALVFPLVSIVSTPIVPDNSDENIKGKTSLFFLYNFKRR